MNRIIKKISAILISTSSVLFVASTPVSAAQYVDVGDCSDSFAGLTSWCYGVGDIHDEETLKTNIWTIAANIAADITVLAAYLVLGFVIYGGYLYLLSGGDTTKVANGKKTIANAFIGLAIVLLANVIFNTLRFILIGGSGDKLLSDCYNSTCVEPADMISGIIQWVVGITGLVAAIFLIIGGISYMTSSGDTSKVEKAKKTILYAVIGLVIVALAEIITGLVTGIIKNANNEEGAYINNSSISYQINKEETYVKRIT
ncbi:hypothetical protein J5491_01300 [Candidatus Saccharibacteria bacterium]|nr:hypothetical protein [Candidatus Saccharibacteria bacterium]